MSLKMGYVTRGQSSDCSRPYRKYDNPAENTIMVVFPGYSTSMSVQRDDEIHPFAMFAYSLLAVNTVVMGLAWLYVVVSSAALAEVRVWGVMAP
jgi:hypothetical protein